MRCAACGYSEAVGALPIDVIVRDGDMIANGKYKFIPITINYEKTILDACHTQYHWQTLYACPNCGTVKMEVK